MRPISEVIDAIKNQVPDTFVSRDEFFTACDGIKKSALTYTSDDNQRLLWHKLAVALVEIIGEPNSEWKTKITEIMKGKVDYKSELRPKVLQ